MNALLSSALLLALAAGPQLPPAADAPGAPELIRRAGNKFYQQDFQAARSLLLEALSAQPSPEDRASAERQLATLAWRFEGDFAGGRSRLDAALATRTGQFDTLLERSRMETAAGRFDAARDEARRALGAAKQDEQRTAATTTLARAVVDEVELKQLDEAKAPAAADVRAARNVVALLRPLVVSEPGLLESSRALLATALLAGDGPAALDAWHSYFRVPKDEPLTEMLVAPSRMLERLLPQRRGARGAASQQAELARALAGSRMFDEAALVALDPAARGRRTLAPDLRDLVAYARSCRRVRRATEAYYRAVAGGRGDAKAFQAELTREAEALWPQLSWSGAAPAFEAAAFAAEVDRRFGGVINLGTTAGTFDLHYGHRVVDEKREVAQYGHTAQIRFTSLDTMVSNGYQSWAWDGRAQHGGWASAGSITQVRSAYAGDALEAWRETTDADAREASDRELLRESAADDARAVANAYAFLPGLRGRVLRQGRDRLLEKLRARGLAGEDLRVAFMAAYDRALLENQIYSHEGRHAIDGTLGLTLTPADKEFRAKLSEVAFATEPRLATGGIFDANIGDATPHGVANERIMRGLVGWMQAHAAEIAGLDATRPLLPQLDRLTDAQIRAAFASMDPLATG